MAVARRSPATTRRFDGRRFTIAAQGLSKNQAKLRAQRMRATQAANARVVPSARGWQIYSAPAKLRKAAPGKGRSRTGWKLMNVRKDGSLGSLFINRKARVPKGEWVKAESHPTKGFKYRPYYHVMKEPKAPHLSTTGRYANRRWVKVDMKGVKEMERPASQGGSWFLADSIRVVPGSMKAA